MTLFETMRPQPPLLAGAIRMREVAGGVVFSLGPIPFSRTNGSDLFICANDLFVEANVRRFIVGG
jgi:hypothetical protein